MAANEVNQYFVIFLWLEFLLFWNKPCLFCFLPFFLFTVEGCWKINKNLMFKMMYIDLLIYQT